MRILHLIVVVTFATGCTSKTFQSSPTHKKLISYGTDWPNTAYVRAHIAEMEQHPYDGCIISVSEETSPTLSGDNLGIKMWTKTRYEASKFEHAIADLRATPFKKFTDNFIQVQSTPGDVDFFNDDEFDAVLHNIKILSRVAKQGGCVGLEIDPEEYTNHHVWTPTLWPESPRAAHTEAQYVDKARERGRQFMRAINSEFPNVKILFLFGPSITASALSRGGHDYRLLLPFIDGMCQAADTGTQIIDGYEFSYGYRTLIAFEEARKLMLKSREYFQDQRAFDRVMRMGFGLWTDNNSGKLGWHPNDEGKNHFQPDTWQTAVYGALSYTDEYVWCWRERYSAWTGKNLSPAYEAAQVRGRSAPGSMTVRQRDLSHIDPNRIPRASSQPDHDDKITFADLLASHDLVFDFRTTGWQFRPDPNDIGTEANWFTPSPGNPGEGRGEGGLWHPIEIQKFWEEQGWDYDGLAWYRRTFTLSHLPPNKPIHLVIGAADESATIWLNGKLIGTHDLGERGWDQRFSFDITNQIRSGENQLTIRVLDRTGPGGLWKGIKIFAPR